MRKEYVKNVILVLAGKEDGPLAFRESGNRLVVDYVMDACRKTKSVDAVALLTGKNEASLLEKRFNAPIVIGSLVDGLSYVAENFACEKFVVTKAVCPMAFGEVYDRIFRLLDERDFVFTETDEKTATAPYGFRFPKLWERFDGEKEFLKLFSEAETASLSGFPHQGELLTEKELADFGTLYEETVVKPQNERTLGIVNYYLSADGTEGIGEWIGSVQRTMEKLAETYELTSYFINSQTEGNIVYEACSKKFGDIIIKFTPSNWRFHKEWVYYHYADPGIMAPMLDYDTGMNMMVLKMIKPGFQVKFDPKNEVLRKFFDFVDAHRIPEEKIEEEKPVPTIMGEFDDYSKAARNSGYEDKFRFSMEKKARLIWERYFEHAQKFYLHRDLHKRNILCWDKGFIAIDPMGVLGPWAFEFAIPFIIELREFPDGLNKELYETMMDYFSRYVDREELLAAMFVFWIFKLNDYCFQKNDGFKLAGWCKKCMETIYFEGVEDPAADDALPQGLTKI